MSTDSSDDPILAALRARGSAIRRVRYRENRSVLLSISRDGRTLNSHRCFRDAPPEIVDAMATVVTARRDPRARRAALRTLREWEGTRRGLERARRNKPRRARKVNGRETGPLRELFRRFNAGKFDGRLPDIPLRVSRRMTRSLGTVRYGRNGSADAGGGARCEQVESERRRSGRNGPDRTRSGRTRSGRTRSEGIGFERTVAEIAISAKLLEPANRAVLEDTLLHEMAHAEAWLLHGHRGHGRVWRQVARRVGCRPRAVNDVRLAGPEH